MLDVISYRLEQVSFAVTGVTVDEEWLFASTEEIEREYGESLQELREKMEHATTPVCEVCCPYP